MKNTTILLAIILIVLGAGAFVYFNSESSAGNPGSSVSGSGDVQKVTLGMKNYNYYPNTIRLKAGQPVSITLDSTVGGCYRSLVIADLGVRANSFNPSQTIDFTPTQKGTFRFACSMGMGTGTIIVE